MTETGEETHERRRSLISADMLRVEREERAQTHSPVSAQLRREPLESCGAHRSNAATHRCTPTHGRTTRRVQSVRIDLFN